MSDEKADRPVDDDDTDKVDVEAVGVVLDAAWLLLLLLVMMMMIMMMMLVASMHNMAQSWTPCGGTDR